MISFIKPFNKFEWMIAIRYLRSKRSDGGISAMTWISLIGISLAVFALIATLAVRSGFRTLFWVQMRMLAYIIHHISIMME